MRHKIPLRHPGAEVGDRREEHLAFDIESFDLYGRHHEVTDAEATATITRLFEGLHLDLEVRATVHTTCDRTLEPTAFEVTFGESEFLRGRNDRELAIEDYEWYPAPYARRALPSEIPMQVFAEGTEPVRTGNDEDDIDPRWRDLGGPFAAGM